MSSTSHHSTRTRFPSEDSEGERAFGNEDNSAPSAPDTDGEVEGSVAMRRAAERGDWPTIQTFLSRRPWLDPCAVGCCCCADPPHDRPPLAHRTVPLRPPLSPSHCFSPARDSACTECGWPKRHGSFAASFIVIAARCGHLDIVNGILNLGGLLSKTSGALDAAENEEAKEPPTRSIPKINSVRKRSRAEEETADRGFPQTNTCSTGNRDVCAGTSDRCVTLILTAALYVAIEEANAAIVRVLARTLFGGNAASSSRVDSGRGLLPLLHAAAIVGHVDTTRALMEEQELDARDVWETVASTDISLIFSPDVSSYVLALLGAERREETRASLQLTPMHIAAAKGRTELVRYFLSLRYGAGRSRMGRRRGEPIGTDTVLELTGWMRVAPVLFSGLNGHADCVSLLCEHGEDVPCIEKTESNHQHVCDDAGGIVISPERVRKDVLEILEDHGG